MIGEKCEVSDCFPSQKKKKSYEWARKPGIGIGQRCQRITQGPVRSHDSGAWFFEDARMNRKLYWLLHLPHGPPKTAGNSKLVAAEAAP